MKVSDIQYKRCTIEDFSAKAARILHVVKAAESVSQVLEARNEYVELIKEFTTASSLSYMRYTINTADEFYLKEKDYYDEITPQVQDFQREFAGAMLASPFRHAL